jgi:hypothetical protein
LVTLFSLSTPQIPSFQALFLLVTKLCHTFLGSRRVFEKPRQAANQFEHLQCWHDAKAEKLRSSKPSRALCVSGRCEFFLRRFFCKNWVLCSGFGVLIFVHFRVGF